MDMGSNVFFSQPLFGGNEIQYMDLYSFIERVLSVLELSDYKTVTHQVVHFLR